MTSDRRKSIREQLEALLGSPDAGWQGSKPKSSTDQKRLPSAPKTAKQVELPPAGKPNSGASVSGRDRTKPSEPGPIESSSKPSRVNYKFPVGARLERDPAIAAIRGDADLNFVRERLGQVVFRGETAPVQKMAQQTVEDVWSRIELGSSILRACPGPDESGYLVGFDFGTSSSKIVVHQPGARDLAFALPVPQEFQVEENGRRQDHLWRTVVWYNPDSDHFCLTPQANASPIEGFKTRMLQGDSQPLVDSVTGLEAATAYLAMLFAYVVGHYRLAAPDGFDRTKHFSRFHFGVPVSSLQGASCEADFKTCCIAAMGLSANARSITLRHVRAALSLASKPHTVTANTPCILFEELAAVVAGYSASPDHRPGPHIIADIGASTLDIATFNILGPDEHVPVFYSSVELLGADSLSVARRLGISESQFESACRGQTNRVIYVTHTRRDPKFRPNNGTPKTLIITGGGRLAPLYGQVFTPYEPALGAPSRTPVPSKNLIYNRETDFARLLLAWGLSQEEVYLPAIKPPNEIEDLLPVNSVLKAQMPSKDQC